MDPDRPPPPPHRTLSSSTSDLFICFTSRHHSSSMKISSKSILSPGRNNRDPSFSLTTSLSRRLRTNRSIKGAASPAMFPSISGKKRGGGGFENAEPSSPKVTCIGQVRIKSKKKQGKRLRSLSRRHSTGDVSFRKLERSRGSSFGSNHENVNGQRNNQRWVHLPLTICEALRAFGSEFSCLFPCRSSSCFSPSDKTEKNTMADDRDRSGHGPSGSCAEVFTRWLFLQDGDDDDDGGRNRRRDTELVVSVCEEEEDHEVMDESVRVSRRHVFDDLKIVNDKIQGCIDEARVSICIPPKNALLLMRCRSDPLKMEALANRLWESTVSQSDEQDDEFDDCVDEIEHETCGLKHSDDANQETESKQKQSIEDAKPVQEANDETEDEMTYFGSLFDEVSDQADDDDVRENATDEMMKQFAERSETTEETVAETNEPELREGLPECLLLMMYEPKLSMEVSKETWVSSKDFIRRQTSRKKPPPLPPVQTTTVKSTDGQPKVTAITTAAATTVLPSLPEAAAVTMLPGRSSCSLPAPSSMAEVLEQKLVNAVGYEPFVLTRCKSEPMRTAAAKLAPDNCFWKNRKLEPLRRASFGVGAAGVGF
ncbi:hypothetical protein QVD17_14207 [Tagetes erecta]|uniref:Uncharacterized protein n=1 Tax=Tagetes erecta TaxID=13708 RepID=A0AAD8KXM0_TARER|nr:hypothetical protein QVD17_14207 [Tagetes erecta]